MPFALLSDPADNIATVLSEVIEGSQVQIGEDCCSSVQALQDIPSLHKIAIKDIHEGSIIVKYGSPMGIATKPIARGEHVHIHNIASLRARRDAR